MEYRKIQEWVLPESSCLRANELYFRRSPEVIYDRKKRSIRIPEEGYVDFSTYFNGYFLNQWKQYTCYEKLRIRIHSKGNLIWNLCAGYRDQEEQRIQITKDPEMEWGAVNIPEEWMEEVPVICYLAVAGGDGGGEILDLILEGVLKEEQEVKPVLILGEWEDSLQLKKNILYFTDLKKKDPSFPPVLLADPKGEAEVFFRKRKIDTSEILYIKRKEGKLWSGYREGCRMLLDGSLGKNYTHGIFMKGDTQLPPDILQKNIAVLEGLKKEYQDGEICGALFENNRLWIQRGCGNLWKNGSPEFMHEYLEMRDVDAVLENCEQEKIEYGGWWYCCVPVTAMRNKGLPLPLRMEEAAAEYGIRLGSAISFNGIGVWDCTSEKRLPQSGEYYRIRNAAIVNSCLYTFHDWNKEDFKILLRKAVMENIVRGRYHDVLMNLLGARDFLRGALWLMKTDDRLVQEEREGRMAELNSYEDLDTILPENIFIAEPDEKMSVLLTKKTILYKDDKGKCLLVEKSAGQSRICMKQLRRMEKNINQYFDRAAESYKENKEWILLRK